MTVLGGFFALFTGGSAREATDDKRLVDFLPSGARVVAHDKASYVDNTLVTGRYTVATFLPLALFAQFRRSTNIYFLLIAVLQLTTTLSPTNKFTTVVPLLGVLLVSLVKEAVEDFSRHLLDHRNNLEPVSVLHADSVWEIVPSRDLVVGDFVRLVEGEAVPADMVLLSIGGSANGMAYVNTAQLDGESSLKSRHTLSEASDACGDSPHKLAALLGGATMVCDAPSSSLSFFAAFFRPRDVLSRRDTRQLTKASTYQNSTTSATSPRAVLGAVADAGVGNLFSLSNSQPPSRTNSNRSLNDSPVASACVPCSVGIDKLLVRGMLLRNVRWAVGVVVYTGFDTKIALNSKVPVNKRSVVERSFDIVNALLASVLAVFCLFVAIGAGMWTTLHTGMENDTWYLTFISGPVLEQSTVHIAINTALASLLLFNNLVPISLIVTVEIAKYLQARTICADPRLVTVSATGAIVPAQVMTSALNESLGLVDCIVTDKTGTLTENKFTLRALSIGGRMYMNDAKTPTAKGWIASQLPAAKAASATGSNAVADALLCLALCNEVLSQRLADDTLEYQSSSPDDVALVLGAAQLGLHVLEREQPHVARLSFDGQIVLVDILAVYPFTHERRRSSVLVRFHGGRCVLFSKGADSLMLHSLRNVDANGSMKQDSLEESTFRDLDRLACSGLRTLVLASREMTSEMALKLVKLRAEAVRLLGGEHRNAMAAATAAAESDLTLLGVSAIEDSLSPGVPTTIARLVKAGISIVVCTGDKIETTVSIAVSTTIASRRSDVVILRSADRFVNLTILAGARLALKERKIWAPGTLNRDLMLVVEGVALDTLLGAFNEEAARTVEGSGIGIVPTKAGAAATPAPPPTPTPTPKPEFQSARTIAAALRDAKTAAAAAKAKSLSTVSAELAEKMYEMGSVFLDSLLPCDREISGATDALKNEVKRSDDRACGIRATMAAVAAATASVEDDNVRRDFEEFLAHSGAVLFCRVSPSQKVKVVQLMQAMRAGTSRTTLAVGDGANDVGMIQAADVGVGICGVEGTRAAISADFALGSFSMLSVLLLVHGRANYRRISLIIVFCIYKNALVVCLLLGFSVIAAWSSVSVFESYTSSLWNIIFTSLPILAVGCMDIDVPDDWLLLLPGAYSSGRLQLEPSHTRMKAWLALAASQAAIIGTMALWCFWCGTFSDGTDSNMIADGLALNFACLLTVSGQLAIEVRSWFRLTYMVFVFSVVSWLIYITATSLNPIDSEMSGVATKLFRYANFWFFAIVAPTAAIMPGLAVRAWARNNEPSLSEFIQERAVAGPFNPDDWNPSFIVDPNLAAVNAFLNLESGRSRYDVLKSVSTTMGVCGDNLGVSGSVLDSDAFEQTILGSVRRSEPTVRSSTENKLGLSRIIKCMNAITSYIAADVSTARARETQRALVLLTASFAEAAAKEGVPAVIVVSANAISYDSGSGSRYLPELGSGSYSPRVTSPQLSSARLQTLSLAAAVSTIVRAPAKVDQIKRILRRINLSLKYYLGMSDTETATEVAEAEAAAAAAMANAALSPELPASPASILNDTIEAFEDGSGVLLPLDWSKLQESFQPKRRGTFFGQALRSFFSTTDSAKRNLGSSSSTNNRTLTAGANSLYGASGSAISELGGANSLYGASGSAISEPDGINAAADSAGVFGMPLPTGALGTPYDDVVQVAAKFDLQELVFGTIATDIPSLNELIDGSITTFEAELSPRGRGKLYSRLRVTFFNALLEERYFTSYFIKKSVVSMRLSIILGLVILSVYLILMIPQTTLPILITRSLIILSICFFLYVMFLPAIQDSGVYTVLINSVAMGVSIFTHLDSDWEQGGAFGLGIFVVSIFLVMRLKFVHACAIAAFDFILSVIVAFRFGYFNVIADHLALYILLSSYCGLSYWKLQCAMHDDFLLEDRLMLEERRGGDLVNSMLPAHVISALRSAGDSMHWSGRVHFEEKCVSVMFIQVVDFELVTRGFASEFVQLLDRLWGLIDAIAERHCVTKLETVGKEYLCCSGLRSERLDHATALASMAIDVLGAVAQLQQLFNTQSTQSGAPQLAVRIGINTGKAVAGVVGSTRPQFVLVGDTVNTASRVAAYGRESVCNVSPATYMRLKSRFNFVSRVVEVKSKGKMTIRYINGRVGSSGLSADAIAALNMRRESLNNHRKSDLDSLEENISSLDATRAETRAHTESAAFLADQQSEPPPALSAQLDFDEQGTISVAYWTSAREAILRSIAHRRQLFDDANMRRIEHREKALVLTWPTFSFRNEELESRWLAGVHSTHGPATRRAAAYLLVYSIYLLSIIVHDNADSNRRRTVNQMIDISALLHILQILILISAIQLSHSKWYSRPADDCALDFDSRLHMWVIYLAAPLVFLLIGLGYSYSVQPISLLLFFVVSTSVTSFGFAVAINIIVSYALFSWRQSIVGIYYLVSSIIMIAFSKATFDFYSRRRFGVAAFMCDEVERNEKLLKYMLPEAMVEQMLTATSAVGRRREPLTFHDVCILYCDVSGFTKLSATLEPSVVIETINKMFTAFEAVALKNGIFKVQTIGVRRRRDQCERHEARHGSLSDASLLARLHCPPLPQDCFVCIAGMPYSDKSYETSASATVETTSFSREPPTPSKTDVDVSVNSQVNSASGPGLPSADSLFNISTLFSLSPRAATSKPDSPPPPSCLSTEATADNTNTIKASGPLLRSASVKPHNDNSVIYSVGTSMPTRNHAPHLRQSSEEKPPADLVPLHLSSSVERSALPAFIMSRVLGQMGVVDPEADDSPKPLASQSRRQLLSGWNSSRFLGARELVPATARAVESAVAGTPNKTVQGEIAHVEQRRSVLNPSLSVSRRQSIIANPGLVAALSAMTRRLSVSSQRTVAATVCAVESAVAGAPNTEREFARRLSVISGSPALDAAALPPQLAPPPVFTLSASASPATNSRNNLHGLVSLSEDDEDVLPYCPKEEEINSTTQRQPFEPAQKVWAITSDEGRAKVPIVQYNAAMMMRQAVDMCKIMSNFESPNPEWGPLKVRIGIHSGDVVGGIIGSKTFRFDIFGTDVLATNSIESAGEPGAILISETTHAALEALNAGPFAVPGLTFHPRNQPVECLGRGALKAYFAEIPGELPPLTFKQQTF